MHFSFKKNGFFSTDIHGDAIPDDAVEITDTEYAALLSALSNGMIISADTNGHPVAVWPVKTLTEIIAAKKQELAAKRWAEESKGLVVDGIIISTDREGRSQLDATLGSLQSGAIQDTPWKGVNGWIDVTVETMQSMVAAVAQHVRACFVCERGHCDAIDALESAAAVESYDISVGWPK